MAHGVEVRPHAQQQELQRLHVPEAQHGASKRRGKRGFPYVSARNSAERHLLEPKRWGFEASESRP